MDDMPMNDDTTIHEWTPADNRQIRFAQRTLLNTKRFLRRIGGKALRIRLHAGEHSILLDISTARELRRAGEHHLESDMLERIAGALQPGDVVYDIGANIGLISLILALRPEGRECLFHAFEPEPRNFRQLTRNIDGNEVASRISPHPLALGDREGEVELFIRGSAGEGRHSVAAKKGSTRSIRVPMVPASQFAASSGRLPTVVKIDVEGAEGFVLAGMEDLVRENPPRDIFMELHNKGLRDRLPDGTAIGAWLIQRGYRLAWEQKRRSGVHCHYRNGVATAGAAATTRQR